MFHRWKQLQQARYILTWYSINQYDTYVFLASSFWASVTSTECLKVQQFVNFEPSGCSQTKYLCIMAELPIKVKSVRWADEERDSQQHHRSDLVQILGPLLVPASEMTSQEKDELWYSPREQSEQKCIARRDADTHAGEDYSNLVTRIYASCFTGIGPSKRDFVQLVEWHSKSLSPRGIERFSLKAVARLRMEDRSNLIEAIVDYSTGGLTPESIRFLSEEESRAARTFARITGLVDALAVHEAVPFREQGSAAKPCRRVVSCCAA